jgi:L-methionine (R)-S-oxide reductase
MGDKPINLDKIVDALNFVSDESSNYYSRTESAIYFVEDDVMRMIEDDEPFDEVAGWEEESIEVARRILADEDDFIRLPDQFEIHEYSIIQEFCGSRTNQAVSEELSDAIRGKGAFRGFRRAIDRLGLTDDWYKYRDDAFKRIARDWCEENNVLYTEETDASRSTGGDVGDAHSTEKERQYDRLLGELRHLLAGERNLIANAANMASLLYHSVPDLNWAGFYFHQDGQLIVGPFQGKPACTRIAIGKGVCGTAASRRETVVVKDVNQFPGHIACDEDSNSEIVVPIERGKRLIGVLDLDSPALGRFDDQDKAGLERLVGVFLECTDTE